MSDLRLFDERYVIDANGCWLWIGTLSKSGYAYYCKRKVNIRGHVYSYIRKYGPIPAGLELDHFFCDVKRCVNPDHVKPETHINNIRRRRYCVIDVKKAAEIREKYKGGRSQTSLAKEYRCTQANISLIVREVYWKP